MHVSGIVQNTMLPIYTSRMVNADRTVIFNKYAPKAENVKLLSSIQPEDILMSKAENG